MYFSWLVVVTVGAVVVAATTERLSLLFGTGTVVVIVD